MAIFLGMPKAFDKLAELLAAEAVAQTAARKAAQAVAQQVQELQQQRHHITRQSAFAGQKLETPSAPAELLTQYMQVQGFAYRREPHRTGWFGAFAGPTQLKAVAELLGLEVPRPEQKSVAA